MIHLVQLCKDSMRNGGCATFLENLAYGLGDSATVVRAMRGDRSEHKKRSFGNYCEYRNLSTDDFIDEAKADGGPVVICIVDGGSDQADELLHVFGDNAWFVYHDHRSLQDMTADLRPDRTVVIREVHERAGIGTFIPHPYRRFFQRSDHEDLVKSSRRPWLSHTRIDSDKRTHWVMEASDLLEVGDLPRIAIYGRENRMYGKFTLQKRWPDWKLSTHEFPRGFGAAAKLCSRFKFDVDMTRIKDDGGGSQYTSLEAMDAGCIIVTASDWGKCPFVTLQVDGPEDLALKLKDHLGSDFQDWSEINWDYLERVHSPKVVADRWKDLLS